MVEKYGLIDLSYIYDVCHLCVYDIYNDLNRPFKEKELERDYKLPQNINGS